VKAEHAACNEQQCEGFQKGRNDDFLLRGACVWDIFINEGFATHQQQVKQAPTIMDVRMYIAYKEYALNIKLAYMGQYTEHSTGYGHKLAKCVAFHVSSARETEKVVIIRWRYVFRGDWYRKRNTFCIYISNSLERSD
jgi:hypothetical protein